jgi:hypothetical protein
MCLDFMTESHKVWPQPGLKLVWPWPWPQACLVLASKILIGLGKIYMSLTLALASASNVVSSNASVAGIPYRKRPYVLGVH